MTAHHLKQTEKIYQATNTSPEYHYQSTKSFNR